MAEIRKASEPGRLRLKLLDSCPSILDGGRSFRNLKYNVLSERGVTRQFEVDGLILYDEVLVIVEVKGGGISPAARRGAPSLVEDLETLLGKAHDQAARVASYLESVDEAVFRTADGKELLLRNCDFSRVIEIAVTLDSISASRPGWADIIESKAPAGSSFRWSVELLDLRVIAELTEFGPQFIHYVDCLSRLPQGILEFNDVLDTFSRYLRDGLELRFRT